jgi:hypothetical protein
MKKSIIQLISATIIISGLILSCKKKETTTTEPTPSATTGGTTTGGTTTGGTTTGGAAGNILTVVSATTGNNTYTLTNFQVNKGGGYYYSYQGNTVPNYHTVITSINGTVTASGVYSITPNVLGTTGTIGVVYVYEGTALFLGSGGTFTASSVNGKQRVQFNNIICGTGSNTLTASADYVQP